MDKPLQKLPIFCPYYQAKVKKEHVWFVTGILRNQEYWAFDRTFDQKNNVLEFFVSPSYEKEFLDLMMFLSKKEYIHNLQKLPNRAKETGKI